MATLQLTEAAPFPAVLADAVKQAMDSTFSAILGGAPALLPAGETLPTSSGLVGIISFVGDVSWSVSLLLPEAVAPVLAQQFAGFEIPLDSPDMADVVGELANVLAGDIVARCDARRVKAQMSLPMVARGHDLNVLTPGGLPSLRLEYRSTVGPFALKLDAARPGTTFGRRPGA
jgi:chemotaxis protein CheX